MAQPIALSDVTFSTITAAVPGVAAFVYADDDSGRVAHLIGRIYHHPEGGFGVAWRCHDGNEIHKQTPFKSAAEALGYVDRVCEKFFAAFWLDEINEELLAAV